jgi:ribosomal protein L11 methyltransferase
LGNTYPALDLAWRSSADIPALLELIHAAIDEFEPQTIHDRAADVGWRVFFRTGTQRDAAAAALHSGLGSQLSAIEPRDVEDDGWARRSQAELKAVRVGRIIVAPPWEVGGRGPGSADRDSGSANRGPETEQPSPESRAPSTDIVIVIDPSTGFGTGHHETTRLCLALMQELDLRGKRVIDVGTGSGVLALAAWKLGASVVAVDHDEDALRNASENIARNGADAAIEVREADLASLEAEPGDLVVANLTEGVLEKYAGRLKALVKADGSLLVSGFSPAVIATTTRALGRSSIKEAIEGDWAAIVLT